MDSFYDEKEKLLKVMLKPALRFCLRNAFGTRKVFEIIRSLLIELAVEELKESGEKANVSRLAVLTGMSRREVTRIYRDAEPIKRPPMLVQRVSNRWQHHPRFTTKASKPRVLSYKGDDSEFAELVRMVSTDVKPGTMLSQLETLDMVEKTRHGLKLKQEVEFFTKDPRKGLELLSKDAATLIEAGEENLFRPRNTRNLHLHTEFDNIYQDDIPAIRQWIFERGQLFHKHVREYLSNYDKDVSGDQAKTAGAKVIVGAFSWTEEKSVNN